MPEAAARFGDETPALISPWNGEDGDGPGGAQHPMEKARRRTARAYGLDTTKPW